MRSEKNTLKTLIKNFKTEPAKLLKCYKQSILD